MQRDCVTVCLGPYAVAPRFLLAGVVCSRVCIGHRTIDFCQSLGQLVSGDVARHMSFAG